LKTLADPLSIARPIEREGAVVLLSGGLDSAIMAGMALERGDRIWPLYVRQGFVWESEEVAAVERFLQGFKGPERERLHGLRVSTFSAPEGYSSRWALDRSCPAPDAQTPDEAVYLPGRNLVLLTQASILAYAVGLRRVQLGILSGNPFPDARPAFIRAFEAAAREAMDRPIRVEIPLARLTKTEALERGARFDLRNTISCLRPQSGLHCGVCNKCAERRKAFARAGVPDPTVYRDAQFSDESGLTPSAPDS
jgi:7-cyano-7-deazaguanine synthase